MERDDTAFAAGCAAAHADLGAGRYVYRWTGHAGHWGHWIAIQLKERFQVDIDGLGLCCVAANAVSYNEGYNSVLAADIDRRFGSGALQSLLAESRLQSEESLGDAKELWRKRHAPA